MAKAMNSGGNDWRALVQETGGGGGRPASEHALRRLLVNQLRWFGFLAGVAVLVTLVAWLVMSWQYQDNRISTVAPSEPLERVYFETDGVLNDAWLERALNLPYGEPVKSISVRDLAMQLESFDQIAMADVALYLPDSLGIRVYEREPLFRIRSRINQETVELLVGADGRPYSGSGYTADHLAALPYLAGVRLEPEARGFAVIPGVDLAARLVIEAGMMVPELASDWKVVSLEAFRPGPHEPGSRIEVRSTRFRQIWFSPADIANEDVGVLREKLDWLRETAGMVDGPQRRIDLTGTREVAVVLDRETSNSRGGHPFR